MQLRTYAPIKPLTPEKFSFYLENHGWKETHRYFVNDKHDLPVVQFRKESDERGLPWEINLPMTTAIADYESCVYQAIVYLSKINVCTEYEVYQEILQEWEEN